MVRAPSIAPLAAESAGAAGMTRVEAKLAFVASPRILRAVP
ncbi:MAG: hypothetical protein ACRDOI_12035 [Trebonia sp.]